ncbi:S9 family peptidase [Psychroflexus planctonicus]|uniref:Peptidase S9 n=1 Tax=Psychroflexus planctonicus TaxID=1526575 RepID=A0ABQ1SH12_9FLAO|nr:alpha/beta fold hydrolase [Psychroflexus planctonicus]GGE34880.1 peptidase S9 [Psychroflexus planctonicus]
MKYKYTIISFVLLFANTVFYAQTSNLSVEHIMQHPSWMGVSPENIQWDEQSKIIYFQDRNSRPEDDSIYMLSGKNFEKLQKIARHEKEETASTFASYSKDQKRKLKTEGNQLIIYKLSKNESKTILELDGRIGNAEFISDQHISFQHNGNLFLLDVERMKLEKLTNFKKGNKPSGSNSSKNETETWLEEENRNLLAEVKAKKEASEARKNQRKEREDKFVFYQEDKQLRQIQLSPNLEHIYFSLRLPSKSKATFVPDFVDESGYTEELSTRPKVGQKPAAEELYLYDIKQDTVFQIETPDLPDLTKLPEFTKDYPDKDWSVWERSLQFSEVKFSERGDFAVIDIRSNDNKHRWICSIDAENKSLKVLDHQHNEAWIGGPGINSYANYATWGFIPNHDEIYFQSEETGYSHLYRFNLKTNTKKALTSGEFEIFDSFISNDKKHWYFTSSEVHSGERHFYKMKMDGSKKQQLTSMKGSNMVSLSPDEKHLAILHSTANQPLELYLQKNSTKAKPVQLTNGASNEFTAYNWKTPEFITFTASDGAEVHARLYQPTSEAKNNAAVVFVHGAGYLQNAHRWWSSYFREYMFHNLLSDLGYTVIDVDYRGSAGYGADWRTGIYRHMGGKDLSDQVDAVQFLVEKYGIDSEKVGIYGGSYGGFITLMAMFNEAETFAAGAALRSVTDWAHYNHAYTSNILNEPTTDPDAYRKSSPIYFAEGLEGNLLIAHGMIDTNVHFQDVVRLSQRLIELQKDNWEMAVYPIEGHGFTQPSSWIDEYKRILKLFDETLLEKY